MVFPGGFWPTTVWHAIFQIIVVTFVSTVSIDTYRLVILNVRNFSQVYFGQRQGKTAAKPWPKLPRITIAPTMGCDGPRPGVLSTCCGKTRFCWTKPQMRPAPAIIWKNIENENSSILAEKVKVCRFGPPSCVFSTSFHNFSRRVSHAVIFGDFARNRLSDTGLWRR